MTTPKQLIDRLREDFGCSLKDERMLFMINALEARLAKEVLRKTDILKTSIKKDESRITLDFPAQQILRLSFKGKELRKSGLNEPFGYKCEGNDIVFDFAHSSGEVALEYLVMPKPFSQSDYAQRQLLLEDSFCEIYIYHILSREALLCDDIERLNNYSTIYAAALRELISSCGSSFSGADKFVNIW